MPFIQYIKNSTGGSTSSFNQLYVSDCVLQYLQIVPNLSFLHPFVSIPLSVLMQTHSFHTNEQFPILSLCPSPFSCQYIQHTYTTNAAFSIYAHITENKCNFYMFLKSNTNTFLLFLRQTHAHTFLQTVSTAALWENNSSPRCSSKYY